MGVPDSVLDRRSSVLVVVDIQDRLAQVMEHRALVVQATCLLVRVAAIVGMPIVATRQYPKGLGDMDLIVRACVEEAGESVEVTWIDKMAFDCFAEPSFAELIGSLDPSQLLLAGMETHICIAQTALAGIGKGIDVHVAADGCCSRDDENRRLALDRLGRAGVVVTTSESAAYELVGEAGTSEFKALLAAVKG